MNWYMGIDVRLFVLAYLILPHLFRNEKCAILILLASLPISLIGQALLMYQNPEVPGVISANTVDFLGWDLVMVPTLYLAFVNWIPSYAMGLTVGHLISNKIDLKSGVLRNCVWFCGWSLLMMTFSLSLWFDKNSRYQEVLLGILLRFSASLSFSILCYSFWLESGLNVQKRSIMVRLFSAKLFGVLQKISYSVFMMHVTWLLYENFQLRTTIDYSPIALINRWISTIVISHAIGIVIYLTVEAPFSKLTRDLLKN